MSTPDRHVSWLGLAATICVLVWACFSLVVWNKHDNCRGVSEFYSENAARYRTQAQDHAYSLKQRSDLLIRAEWYDTISAKFARVAARPWLPYPTAPLLTKDEKAESLRRTEAARAALQP